MIPEIVQTRTLLFTGSNDRNDNERMSLTEHPEDVDADLYNPPGERAADGVDIRSWVQQETEYV